MKKTAKIFKTDDPEYLNESTAFVHDSLASMGIDNKHALKSEVLFEETLERFIAHAGENDRFQVTVGRFMGEVSVFIKMHGDEFDICSAETGSTEDEEDPLSLDAIRSVLIKSYGEKFRYSHKNGFNRVRISTDDSRKALYATLLAMAMGIIVGLIAQYLLPGAVSDVLSDYILTPVKSMFMNALKIIIAPVVFFSIVTCFSQYESISQFGKLGVKIFFMYFLTTIIAILLSLGLSSAFKPGELGFALAGNGALMAVDINSNIDTSLINTIVGIVPSNFLAPFLNSTTLQLIFLAVLCGLSLGVLGNSAPGLKEMFDNLNSLFLTVTGLIARFIPVAVFCSLALMVMSLDLSAFKALLGATALQISAVMCMLIVYGILIMLFARLNPIKFYQKAKEGMLTSFSLSSSSAAMPTNMKVCTDKLGISPKICNFSIPLGATLNMDGTSILLTVMGLFLARAYGVDIKPSDMLSVAFTIILISLGSPGVPGAGIVCTGVILQVLNVPVEAVGLMIPIYPLFDMIDTMSNTTGDLAASLIVARSEGLLDMEKYNGKDF